jgi:hypothetical protein
MAVPAVIPKLLSYFPTFDGMLTAAGSLVYQTPLTTTVTHVILMTIHNTDGSPHTFTIWYQSTNGTPTLSDAHVIYKAVPIAANANVTIAIPWIAGQAQGGATFGNISAAADADSVLQLSIFGAEIDTTSPTVGRSIPGASFQGVLTVTVGDSVLMVSLATTTVMMLMSVILCNVDSVSHDVTIAFHFDSFSGFHTQKVVTVPANDTLVVTDSFILDGNGAGNSYLAAGCDTGSVVTATASALAINLTP